MIRASVILAVFLLAPTPHAADLRSRSWEVLSGGMSDSNPVKRAQALAAIGTLGLTQRSISAVEAGLNDKDSFVRQTAVAVLGDMRSRRSIPKLRQALNDDAPEVKFAAAKTLWEMGDRRGRGILIGILSGEEKSSSGFVKSQMRQAKKDLHEPVGLAKFGLSAGAGTLFGPFAMGLGFAEDMLKDQGAPSRALAANLLAKDSDAQSLEQLEQALDDKNAGVRAAAARALGRRFSRSSIPKLEPLLEDKAEGPRYMAAAAIIRLTGKKSIVPQKPKAQENDPLTR
jgi:HEAT repeat protein